VVGWNANAGSPREWSQRRKIAVVVGSLVFLALFFAAISDPNRQPSAEPEESEPAPGEIGFLSPDQGDTVHREWVVVRGTAPGGAEIVLDLSIRPDESTMADRDGAWEMRGIELEEGENELTFRIGDDESTQAVLRIFYRPPAADASRTPRPSRSPQPSATPRPTPAPTPVPTPVPPPPTPVPAFSEIVLSGNGDSVPTFTIPSDRAAIARISYSGGSNFAVWSVASDGSYNDLLVNEIGGYTGTVLFDELDGVHSVAFEVTASGPWTIRIQPVTSARSWNGVSPLTGSGDDVALVSPPFSGFTTVTLQHTGSSNFAIWAYSPSDTDLLVNEIGPYLGDVLVAGGTFLLEVTADGAWTVAPH
jgi:hypothetical protein